MPADNRYTSAGRGDYVFTSESVTEGHPDKVCDQISDAILDSIIAKEIELMLGGYKTPAGKHTEVSEARVACEVMVTEGQVFLAGEIRTAAYVDIDRLVRDVVADIGYTDPDSGFHYRSIGITNSIHEQSPDIARGVDESFEVQHGNATSDPLERIGAGDQGLMFGFACTETSTLMPVPIYLAQRLSQRLAQVRKDGNLDYLRPDGKTQVGVRYRSGRPVAVETVLLSSQHEDRADIERYIKTDLIRQVIRPVLDESGLPWQDAEVYVNPTGRFVAGGPAADTGLTGRKIIADTYGGYSRHGGGAFSGKDCTKVDRSASYAARWIAKNIVASGLAQRAEVQIAYGIGMARPLSLMVDCMGTNTVEERQITTAVEQVFDLRPAAIIRDLDLLRPIFLKTATYGHFGRELPEFTWEAVNRTHALLTAANA